jgi:murein DD-endopeptidase MepM/ murein hydrolase activator NlpD
MRPVAAEFEISQAFGSMPTAGVVPNINAPGTAAYYVALYGDYQPLGHAGLDIATPVGTPIHSITAGTVIWADWDVNLPGGPNDWYARWFFYQHFGGRLTLVQQDGTGFINAYAHQSKILVQAGQRVAEGQLIGLTGDSSGGADGQLAPHLHVERIVATSYISGGGLIYGRDDPSADFSAFRPLSSTPQKEASEMPVSKRVDGTFKTKHRLPLNKAYTLSVKDDGISANFAVNGVGHYVITAYLRGEGLLDGQRLEAQFVIIKGGKASGHFTQDIDGSTDGKFNKVIHFDRKVEAGTVITCLVTARNGENAYLTGFGAEVTTYQ